MASRTDANLTPVVTYSVSQLLLLAARVGVVYVIMGQTPAPCEDKITIALAATQPPARGRKVC